MANAKYHPFNNPDYEEAEREYLASHVTPSQTYVREIAKAAANTVASFYLGIFFGGILGAACMFIIIQPR